MLGFLLNLLWGIGYESFQRSICEFLIFGLMCHRNLAVMSLSLFGLVELLIPLEVRFAWSRGFGGADGSSQEKGNSG